MRISLSLAACLVSLGASTIAGAQDCPAAAGRQVRVEGAAVVRLPPDRVSFSVGVDTQAPSVALAFKTNNTKLNGVLAALKAKGVQAKELQTSNLEISSRDEDGKKLTGFRVSNLVTVTREDPASVGELLQAAVAAGANQAGGLRFYVAEPSKLQQRGLELAYNDAKAKAEALATLAGQALGEALCVSDGSPVTRGLQNSNLAALAYVSGPAAVEIGTEQISFGVSVVYALKER